MNGLPPLASLPMISFQPPYNSELYHNNAKTWHRLRRWAGLKSQGAPTPLWVRLLDKMLRNMSLKGKDQHTCELIYRVLVLAIETWQLAPDDARFIRAYIWPERRKCSPRPYSFRRYP